MRRARPAGVPRVSLMVAAARKRPTIAIIGAGLSGALTALHLLAGSDGAARILLVEKARGFGKGVAYSTRHGAHLLNVRAGNMSAFPDQPGHFIDWVRENQVAMYPGDGNGFVSRADYGRYLQELLGQAAKGHGALGRLVLVADDAVSLARTEDGAGLSLVTGVGRSYRIDAAVLAVGNFPPDPPPGVAQTLLQSPRFHTDPWATGTLDHVKPDEPVLLLGTSLTMVDVAISLTDRGHRGPIMALSRRGLLPRRHADPGHPAPPVIPTLTPSLAGSLRSVRAAVGAAQARGGGWHEVIDSLRGATAGYWQNLPIKARLRFIRHLRPWWDVHRHRLAPTIACRIREMMDEGRLTVVAGRILSLDADASTLRLRFRRRGQTTGETADYAHAINCVGPGGDIARTRDPLLRNLLEQGLVVPDPLRLGLDTDEVGRLRTAGGATVPGLYAVGPIMKGTSWEITAVPDIRLQAKNLAATILREIVAG
ncbi:FAD/NAD(P)-binding protein [Niveispirillum fermenti]|uniref:FAD/NAD(P)-binding protein n=1 Tax=Niveispirillum fermenti TaxID=1233113 RepID=UPI003A854969